MLGREFVCGVVFVGLAAAGACANRAQGPSIPPEPSSPMIVVDAGAAPAPPRVAKATATATPPRDVPTMLRTGGTAAEWSCAPAGTLDALNKTVADPNALTDARLHAIEGLTWIPDAAAADTLGAIAYGRSPHAAADGGVDAGAGIEDATLRSAAVIALARRLGRAAVPQLRALLEDALPDVRAAAIRGLAIAGGAEAKSALEARIEREDAPALREAIQRSLTQMQP